MSICGPEFWSGGSSILSQSGLLNARVTMKDAQTYHTFRHSSSSVFSDEHS